MADFKAVNGLTNGSFDNMFNGFNLKPNAADQGSSVSTAGIDKVVGSSDETELALTLLIPAKAEWDIFPKASNDTIYRMAASIDKYGLLHRITVWEQPDGKYMILGGHTRYAAYSWLNDNVHEEGKDWSKIPVKVYKADQLTEDDAHRVFLVSNTDQRTMATSVITAAYMDLLKLEQKHAFYGSGIYSRTAAAKQADVSESTFNLYLSFRKLIPELRELLDSGDIGIWPAFSLSHLNEDLQRYMLENYSDLLHGKSLSKEFGKILQKCESIPELTGVIEEWLTRPQTYTYRVTSHVKMEKNETAIAVLVPKSMRQSVKHILMESVDKMGLDEDAKRRFIESLTSQD